MKMPWAFHLTFAVAIALLLGVAIGLALADFYGPVGSGFFGFLHHWKELAGSVLAIIAAIYAVIPVYRQLHVNSLQAKIQVRDYLYSRAYGASEVVSDLEKIRGRLIPGPYKDYSPILAEIHEYLETIERRYHEVPAVYGEIITALKLIGEERFRLISEKPNSQTLLQSWRAVDTAVGETTDALTKLHKQLRAQVTSLDSKIVQSAIREL
jgi:hypothetical protein